MKSPSPSYTLTYEHRPGYLYVLVDAESVTAEMALKYTSEILETCEAHKVEKVLLHRDIPVVLPVGDMFFTMKSIAERLGGVRQVALLNRYIPLQYELDLVAMIANNRGGNFAVFHEEAEAEKWLVGVGTQLSKGKSPG
jgi:hypothetical protein